jgi:hypothetical protein
MRSQWCREHIDKTAEECGLGPDTVSEVKQAAKFCDEFPTFVDCGTKALMALIRVKDEQVRDRAISLAQNALNASTPTGGKKQKSLTEREIKKLIDRADLEVRKELQKDPAPPKGPKPAPAPMKDPVTEKRYCMYFPRHWQEGDPCNAPGKTLDGCTPEKRAAKNCPIPWTEPEEKDPEPYEGSRVTGDTFAPTDDRASAVVRRQPVIAGNLPEPAAVYKVQAGREEQVTIRNMIKYGDAEDEQDAVQMMFEEGAAVYLNKIEARCQNEADLIGEELT